MAGRLRGTADTGSIGRLCKLYRSTLRTNSNKGVLDSGNDNDKKEAVKKMCRALLAVLYHSVKLSDSDVRHQFCPEKSWCEYKKTRKEKINENHLDPRVSPSSYFLYSRDSVLQISLREASQVSPRTRMRASMLSSGKGVLNT